MRLGHRFARRARIVLLVGFVAGCSAIETSRPTRASISLGSESAAQSSAELTDGNAVYGESTNSFNQESGSRTERGLGILLMAAGAFALFIVALGFYKLLQGL